MSMTYSEFEDELLVAIVAAADAASGKIELRVTGEGRKPRHCRKGGAVRRRQTAGRSRGAVLK